MLTAAACGEDDERTVQVGDDDCTRLSACSITDEDCQQAVFDLTACVRGDGKLPLPPIRTLSREQLAAELAANQSEPSAEASEATRAVELVFSALHLIAPQTTLSDAAVAQQASSIAAYYRRKEKDITIISDATMEREQAMNVLSHELTHYLQDRAGQLRSVSNVTLDESVSIRALTEGDAVVTSYRAYAVMRGIVPNQLRWDSLWEQLEENIVRATEASPSPLLAASSQLPYVISPPALELAWERGGRAQVEQFFDSPPATQLDWLEGSIVYSQAEVLACFPALPPEGFELIAADSLGIAGVFALLGALDLDRASLDVAGEWRQDRLAVYVNKAAADGGSLEVLAAWRIRFADAASASNVEDLLQALELDITRTGSELLIRVQSGVDASLDAASCPTDEQFAAAPRRTREVEASLRAALPHVHPTWPSFDH
ncbi:MAG TPA: hypothetical protein VMF89_19740 [Polyangiales bacterium]|nr:hypothetical protein [Polyangiales bacterium]